MSRIYDIVVYGASGFTGEYVLEDLINSIKNENNIKIAIAGRNENKLKTTLSKCAKYTDIDWVEQIPLILADSSDSESLNLMAKQCKIVINCVGPFRFYGEPVVKACIEHGTHHLDVSGEPEYLERIQLNYDKLAKEKNVYVIGSCALLSTLADIGIQFMEKNFKGKLNEVELFYKTNSVSSVNNGTWQSLIHSISNHDNLNKVRQQLYPVKLDKPKIPQKFRGVLFHSPEVNSWCLLYPNSDRSVVYRTQRYLYENKLKPNMTQLFSYMCFPSLFASIVVLMFSIFFSLAVRFQTTRRLLEKYPEFFSAGVFTRKGPSREEVKKSTFSCTFIGKGWSSDIDGPTDSKIITRVDGLEPGYVTTSLMIVEAARTILNEPDLMPKSGGVYTSGAALRNTSYLKAIQERLKFKVIEESLKDK